MGHSKKSKKPSHEPSKESTKSSVIEGYPVFRFDKIDKNGEFAFDTSRDDFKHRKVLDNHYMNVAYQSSHRKFSH